MYVGSTLSYSIKIDDEVDRRISRVVFKMQVGIVTGFTSAPNLEMHKAVNLSPIGPTAAHGLHQPSSLLLSPPRLPRREASTYSQIRSLHRCLDRNVNRPTEPPLTSSSSSSSSTSADVSSGMPINTIKNHDALTNANTTTTANTVYTPPTCDPPFTTHLGLIGHLRIHRTEDGKPVPGAPTYTPRTCQDCPYSTHTFIDRMCLFGHNRVHENTR
ncbi:hypothetical protein SprV_1002825100 [Sparganum proliferum]